VNPDGNLLVALARSIDPVEFDMLREEAGFKPPNDFDFERMRGPLTALRLPTDDCYEYLWAIYECGLEPLQRFSAAIRQYVAIVYVHCNRLRAWGITVAGDYCYMLVEATLQNLASAPLVRDFLWRLTDEQGAADGYNPRFAQWSWVTLDSALGGTEATKRGQLAGVLSRPLDFETELELRVCVRSLADWRSLYQRACAAGGCSGAPFDAFFA
jgi:hypothetical protein